MSTVITAANGLRMKLLWTGIVALGAVSLAIVALNRGETVDPAHYYFRTVPLFETAAPKYAWLNNIVAVGTGHRPPEGPVYQVFEVL